MHGWTHCALRTRSRRMRGGEEVGMGGKRASTSRWAMVILSIIIIEISKWV